MTHNQTLPGAPVQNIPLHNASSSHSKISDIAADTADYIKPAVNQIKENINSMGKSGLNALDNVSSKVDKAKDVVEEEVKKIFPSIRQFAKERPVAAIGLSLLTAYMFKNLFLRK